MLKRICLIMHKKITFFWHPKNLSWIFMIFLLIIPVVLAQNEPANVVLTFVDATSKEVISDVFVNIDLNGKTTSYFLEKDETLKLKLESSEYRLKFLINDPATKGYDYYGEAFLPVENNLVKVIYLYPVGSLSGFVKDKLDTAIAEADLNFDCNKALNVNFPKISDKFGSFSLDYIPVGNCKVYGSYKESLGVEEIEIKQGMKNFVDVKLDAVLIPPKNKNYLSVSIGTVIILLLIISGLVYYFTRKAKTLETKEKKEEKEIKELKEEIKEVKSFEDLSKREKDIFKTLRDNEKKVVEYLIEQKEPVYFSKIHFKTGLSKGSLFRNLRTLERKNIIITTKEGKVRKVRLSDWFLGK